MLHYGNQTWLRALKGVPVDQREVSGACGVWSVRDLVAHLAAYEQVLVEVLKGLTGEKQATPSLDLWQQGGEKFNEASISKRQGLKYEEVLAEYQQADDQVMSLIEKFPEEKLREKGTIPWYGAEYSIEDLIVYQYYGHKREHSAQVEGFRDRVKK